MNTDMFPTKLCPHIYSSAMKAVRLAGMKHNTSSATLFQLILIFFSFRFNYLHIFSSAGARLCRFAHKELIAEDEAGHTEIDGGLDPENAELG